MPKYIVQMRRGTTEEWAAHSDIIPRDGEIVIETLEDGGKNLYIGDGVTPFENLTPFSSGADIDEKLNKKADRVNGTVISANQTFADLREWVDGNPSEEDRFGYFVTFGTNGKIQKATSANVVTGVVIQSAGFSTGVSPDKLNEDDTIKGAYDFVAFNGLVTVRDDGTPIIGDYCIASDDGVATASPNSFGYKVVERVDDTHINIYFSTNADALKRLQDNIDSAIESIVIDLVTTTKAGLMSPADKIKLDAIEEGAQVNQNAFANVKVGSQTVSAYAPDSTVALKAGSNIEITIDDTDNVVISSTAAGIDTATQAKDGLMSAIDKKRLDNLQGVDVTEDAPADDVRIWIDPSEDYGDIFAAVQMTPQIVDSMAEMTDTGKLYVLTTDSHVYFYDNGAWQDSGMSYSGTTVVQETGDSSTSVMSQEAVTKEFENTLSLKVPKTSIPADANLDTYIVPGTYKVISDTIAVSIVNIPEPQTGILIVTQLSNENCGLQFYFTMTSGRIYFRRFQLIGSTYQYTEWMQVGNQKDIDVLNNYVLLRTIPEDDWVSGSILDSTGQDVNSTLTIRTQSYYEVPTNALIRFRGVKYLGHTSSGADAETVKFVLTYNKDKKFIRRLKGIEDVYLDSNVKYVRFTYGYASGTGGSITEAEVPRYAKYAVYEIMGPVQGDLELLESTLQFNNHIAKVNLTYNHNVGFKYVLDEFGKYVRVVDESLVATPLIPTNGAYVCIPKLNEDIIHGATDVGDIYVYFYTKSTGNGSFKLAETMFNVVDEHGVRGCMSKDYEGARMFATAFNVYVQIVYNPRSKVIPDVIIWDGEHIGGDITLGVWYRGKRTDEGSVEQIAYKEGLGCSTIVVPNTAKYLFIKNYSWTAPEDVLEVRFINALYRDSDNKLQYKVVRYSTTTGYGTDCIVLPVDDTTTKYQEFEVCLAFAHPHGDAECKHVRIGDINNRISYDGEYHTIAEPVGGGTLRISRARDISSVQWECKKKTVAVGNVDYFNKGEIYNGIPYCSYWSTPKAYGWHVSKHTFLNAANDEDSIFYAEKAHHAQNNQGDDYYYGTGYGTVCSLFALLAGGFPYPISTHYMHSNPDVNLTFTNQMIPGSVMTGDDNDHTFLYEGAYHGQHGYSYSLYEGAGPVCGRRSFYDFDRATFGQHGYRYADNYRISVTLRDGFLPDFQDSPYNIVDGEIKNGYARPYRGDQGVYTNLQDVIINIKENSTKLYVREYFITHPSNKPNVDIINWKDEAPVRAYDVSGTSFVIPKEDLIGDTVQDVESHSKFFAVWTEKSLNGAPPTEVPAVYECFEFVVLPTFVDRDTWSCKKVSDLVTEFSTYNQLINPKLFNDYIYHDRVMKHVYGTSLLVQGNSSDYSYITLSKKTINPFIPNHVYYFLPIGHGLDSKCSLRVYLPNGTSSEKIHDTSSSAYGHRFVYQPTDDRIPFLRFHINSGTNIADPVIITLGCIDLTKIFGAGNEPQEEYDEDGNLKDRRLAEVVRYAQYERLYSPHRMLNEEDCILQVPDCEHWYTRYNGNPTIPYTNDFTKYQSIVRAIYTKNQEMQMFCKGHYGAYIIPINRDTQNPDPDPGPSPDGD